MYVCLCHSVSDKTVKALMKKGNRSVKDIQKRCLAGTDCGACLDGLREMVEGDAKSTGTRGKLSSAK